VVVVVYVDVQLLAADIRHERNVILQCIRFLTQHYQLHETDQQPPGTATAAVPAAANTANSSDGNDVIVDDGNCVTDECEVKGVDVSSGDETYRQNLQQLSCTATTTTTMTADGSDVITVCRSEVKNVDLSSATTSPKEHGVSVCDIDTNGNNCRCEVSQQCTGCNASSNVCDNLDQLSMTACGSLEVQHSSVAGMHNNNICSSSDQLSDRVCGLSRSVCGLNGSECDNLEMPRSVSSAVGVCNSEMCDISVQLSDDGNDISDQRCGSVYGNSDVQSVTSAAVECNSGTEDILDQLNGSVCG